MTERDKVKQKIIALLNKTTDAGATEQEALLAAEKAAQLMEHYDIAATELDIKNTKSITKTVKAQKFGRGKVGAYFTVRLAQLFDCKVWGSGDSQYTFFGFPEDVEVAAYLFEVLSNTVLFEIQKYKTTKEYAELRTAGYHGKTLTSSFHKGLESRISDRLEELSDDKKANIESNTGTALVLLKEQQVEDDFDDLGVSLRKTYTRRTVGSNSAYNTGQDRGDKVNINSGLGGSSDRKVIG